MKKFCLIFTLAFSLLNLVAQDQTIQKSGLSGTNSSIIITTNIAGLVLRTFTNYASVRATAIPATNAIYVLGAVTNGDGGHGTFYWNPSNTTTDDNGSVLKLATVVTGRYLRQAVGDVSVEWFGAKGNDSTDDTTAITRAINAAAGRGVTFGTNKTYLVTDTLSVTNASLKLNGSTIHLVLTGDKEGIQLRDNSDIRGSGGTINLVGSGLVGTGGNLQTPVVIGGYISNLGFTNISIRDVAITGNRVGGNGVLITGNSHNIWVDNVTFPSSTNMGCAVIAHWAGDGSVPPVLTTHPYNIKISNIKAALMTYTNASDDGFGVIALSGVYNVDVNNVTVDRCNEAALLIVAGDYGYMYAGAGLSNSILNGISVKNVTCQDTRGYGAYINSCADNYSGAPILNMPLLMENCTFTGPGATSVKAGIMMQKLQGPSIINCVGAGFKYGFELEESTSKILIKGGMAFFNNKHGVYIEHGTSDTIDNIIDGLDSFTNGQDGSNAAGIYVGASSRIIVKNCKLGSSSDTQIWGIRTDASLYTSLLDNFNRGHKAGGVAYSLGNASDYTAIWEFRGNNNNGGATYRNGLTHVATSRNVGVNNVIDTVLTSDTTAPSSGTWITGDRVYFENPSTSIGVGAYCSAGGSPGTWVAISPSGGSGTVNKLSKWSSATALTNSGVTDDGTTITVPTETFHVVSGASGFTNSVQIEAGSKLQFGGTFPGTPGDVALVRGATGIISVTDNTSSGYGGGFAYPAFNPIVVSAGGTIPAPTRKSVAVLGNPGAVTLNTTTAIASGVNGQELLLIGTSDSSTVTVPNNANTKLSAATRLLKQKDVLLLQYDINLAAWLEIAYNGTYSFVSYDKFDTTQFQTNSGIVSVMNGARITNLVVVASGSSNAVVVVDTNGVAATIVGPNGGLAIGSLTPAGAGNLTVATNTTSGGQLFANSSITTNVAVKVTPVAASTTNALEIIGNSGNSAFGMNGGLTIGALTQAGAGSIIATNSITTSNKFVVVGGTVTASTPMLTMSQTINNGAVLFNSGLDISVIDSVYSAGSTIFDFKSGSLGTASRLKQDTRGNLTVGGTNTQIIFGPNGQTFPGIYLNNNSGSAIGAVMRWQANGTTTWGFGTDYNANGQTNFWLYDTKDLKDGLFFAPGTAFLTVGNHTNSASQLSVSGNVSIGSASTSIQTAAPTDGLFVQGGIKQAAGATISITSGTNQRAGDATLVGGTVTVANTTVTANTKMQLTRHTSGGTLGTAITYTTSAGVSFTITSDNILDTSTFTYFLFETP